MPGRDRRTTFGRICYAVGRCSQQGQTQNPSISFGQSHGIEQLERIQSGALHAMLVAIWSCRNEGTVEVSH